MAFGSARQAFLGENPQSVNIRAEIERAVAEAKNIAAAREALAAERAEVERLKAGAVEIFRQYRREHEAEVAAKFAEEKAAFAAEVAAWRDRVAAAAAVLGEEVPAV